MAVNYIQQEWKAFPTLERENNKHEICELLRIKQGKFCLLKVRLNFD